MKGKKQHHEEHVDETWLLPYSDMLTLLLALFIVMFAMSRVDNEKFQKISQQFNVIFSGGTGILAEGGEGGTGANLVPGSSTGNGGKSDSIVEQDKMAEIRNSLQQEIKNSGYDDKVKIDLGSEGLNITIQDTVLFNSGDADILDKFDAVLFKISDMLKGLDNDIRISGHTDNVPIKNKKFRDNWDLSYMRAANVMNFMIATGNISPDRFSIQANGEFKPKYDNSTVEGRAKNRSVEILVVRKYAPPQDKDSK